MEWPSACRVWIGNTTRHSLTSSMQQTNFLRVHFGQILHQPIGMSQLQFLQLRAASRHGERFGANMLGAANVQRGVTDHEDLVAGQDFIEQTAAAQFGDGGDLIAVFVVVGECAGLENLPQLEAAQLDFSAQPDVAGQQADSRRPGQRMELMDELPNAGQNDAPGRRQQRIEPEYVAIEEAAEIFPRRLDLVLQEKLARDSGVRASGELELLGAVGNVELRRESASERPHPGPSRVDECAVDIKQNKSNHAPRLNRRPVGRQQGLLSPYFRCCSRRIWLIGRYMDSREALV